MRRAPAWLAELLVAVAAGGGNVLDVSHVRDGIELAVAQTGIELTVEVPGAEHAVAVTRALGAAGYALEPVGLSSPYARGWASTLAIH